MLKISAAREGKLVLQVAHFFAYYIKYDTMRNITFEQFYYVKRVYLSTHIEENYDELNNCSEVNGPTDA